MTIGDWLALLQLLALVVQLTAIAILTWVCRKDIAKAWKDWRQS